MNNNNSTIETTPMLYAEQLQAASLSYCVVCWQEQHAHLDYPAQCERRLCSEHASYHATAKERRIQARSAHRMRTVNFVLVAGDEQPLPKLWYPYCPHVNRKCYPANWSRISYALRRACGFRCEWCHDSHGVSVHHRGAPYPDGRPGNPHDKRDCRRENLVVLCKSCHEWIERKPS